MIFLPILERELRVRARSRATYWARFVAALLAALICLPLLTWGETAVDPASLGNYVFTSAVILAFILCCGACLLTSDVVSRERRGGDAGLPLLSQRPAMAILFAQPAFAALAARSCLR